MRRVETKILKRGEKLGQGVGALETMPYIPSTSHFLFWTPD